MKIAKFFSALFGILGTVLLVITPALCLINRNAQPKAMELPPEASAAAEALMEALTVSDYEAAQSLIYGQPDLGLTPGPSEGIPKMVWDALQESLVYSFSGDCYSKGTDIFRDVTLTYLDAAAVSDAIPGISRTLLEQKTAAAEDPTTLYGEDGNLRADISQSILREAAAQALAAGETNSVQVTLQLIQQEGRWLVLPERSLFTALSGGTL